MAGILAAIGILVVAIAAYAVFRYIATVKGGQHIQASLLAEIEPIINALKAGEEPPLQEIEAAAHDSRIRSLLYRVLQEMDRGDLFPNDQNRLELIAESDLVAWLMHPNELGNPPEKIELAQKISRTEGETPEETEEYDFFVFRFTDNHDKEGAEEKWLAGVAGPYWGSKVEGFTPPGVFSRFEPFDSYTPEEHLKRAEEIVLKRIG